MIIAIADVLSRGDLAAARRLLEESEWVDGKGTAGHQAAAAKDNVQIPAEHPAARRVGAAITQALGRNPLFMSAALPAHILPPMFNRYSGGQHFGSHVDGAIRQNPETGQRIRTDLSATLFFADPGEYEGGELMIQDTYGTKGVKLPAGHLVLYPSTSVHHVNPVTRGSRLCSFFWIQSLIRDDGQRAILFELDQAIQRLGVGKAADPSIVQLTGVYHNLLRQWAQT